MNIKHDREKVLKKGIKLFWDQGYSNLGVDKICKTTGMTKGAFYNAYKSKENFLLQCLESYNQTNIKFLEELLNKTENSAINRLKDMYIYMLKDQPNQNYAGCMMNNMMSEVGSLNEKVAQTTEQSFNNLLQVIEPVVKEAQEEGGITCKVDSESITELIHTSFFGILTRAKTTKDSTKAIHTITTLLNSLK